MARRFQLSPEALAKIDELQRRDQAITQRRLDQERQNDEAGQARHEAILARIAQRKTTTRRKPTTPRLWQKIGGEQCPEELKPLYQELAEAYARCATEHEIQLHYLRWKYAHAKELAAARAAVQARQDAQTATYNTNRRAFTRYHDDDEAILADLDGHHHTR